MDLSVFKWLFLQVFITLFDICDFGRKKIKKIVFISHASGTGGAELALISLLNCLKREEYSCVVLAPQGGSFHGNLREIGVETIETIRLPWISTSFFIGSYKVCNPIAIFYNVYLILKYKIELKKIIQQLKADFVFTNTLFAHIAGGFAAKQMRLPLVWYFHDTIKVRQPFRRLFWILVNFISPRIVCNSSFTMQMIEQETNLSNNQVIYPVVEQENISQEEQKKLKSEFNIRQEDVVISIVGRITQGKGQLEFLKAIYEVKKEFSNIKCFIIGSTELGVESYMDEIKKFMEEFKMNSYVTLTGYQKRPQLWVSISDVIVIPSKYSESFGRVALEALLFKKSVIASRLGGLPEVIKDGRSGILVKPGNVEELVEALRRLISDPDLRSKYGHNGRDEVVSLFSPGNFSKSVNELFDSL